MIYYFTKDRALSSKYSSSTVNCKAFNLEFFFFFLVFVSLGLGESEPTTAPSATQQLSLCVEARRGFCLGCRLKALLNQHSARQSKFQELEGVCVPARRNILQPRLARLPKHTVSAARTLLGAKKPTHSAGYSSSRQIPILMSIGGNKKDKSLGSSTLLAETPSDAFMTNRQQLAPE